jgi:hypothetical protein
MIDTINDMQSADRIILFYFHLILSYSSNLVISSGSIKRFCKSGTVIIYSSYVHATLCIFSYELVIN